MFFGGIAVNSYLFSIIGIVLISSMITAIMPEGKMSGIVKSMTKLICLFIIISPIFQFFQNVKRIDAGKFYQDIFKNSVIETDEEFIKYYSESTMSYMENALEQEIFEKYAINVCIWLDWTYSTENIWNLYPERKIQINQIYVRTEQEMNEEEKNILWEYLTQNYCSEVLIE